MIPRVGMYIVEKDVYTGEDINFWRINTVEPAMTTVISAEVDANTVETIRAPDLLKLKEEGNGLYLRIGVITGLWNVKYPRSVDERWGTWEEGDPESAFRKGIIVGFLTPETSPEYDPSPDSEVWLLKYKNRDAELTPVVANNAQYPIIAKARLHIWRFSFEQASQEDVKHMLERRPDMVQIIFYKRTTR